MFEQDSITAVIPVQPAGPHSARLSPRRLLAQAATEWRLPEKAIIAICSIPFLIALSGVVTALLGKEVYKWFTGEDRFAENLQVLFFSLAFILSLAITRRLWRAGRKVMALLYVVASLGLFFLIGEELSWGQRIFGWETPESFKAMNKQEEATVHNIRGVESAFKWIQLLVGAYGAILPLVFLWPSALPRYRETISMLAPHYALAPYFFLLFVWRIYRNLFEAPRRYYFVIQDYNEVLELILAVGFFMYMFFQLRRISARTGASSMKPEPEVALMT